MEDDLEKRFKEIEEKDESRLKVAEKNFKYHFEQIEKRIGDVQKYPTFIILALTVIIIGIGFFSAFNLNKEIERLRQFETDTKASTVQARKEMKDDIDSTRNELKNEIKESFAKGIKMPDVILLSDIDKLLENQTLIAKISPAKKGEQKFRVRVSIIFKNEGKGASEPILVKLYSTDDLSHGSKSSDERDFTYESYFPPDKFAFKSGILPAGVSVSITAGFDIRDYNERIEKFPMLIKVYFGGDSPTQSRFFLKIPKQQG